MIARSGHYRLCIHRPMTKLDIIGIVVGLMFLGWALGIWQGAAQVDRAWKSKIEERSRADAYGQALPIYEDSQGNVYYAAAQRRWHMQDTREDAWRVSAK